MGQSPVNPVQQALKEAVTRMRGNETGLQPVGPILTTEVQVYGSITKALLNTGSPVSITSLDNFLNVVSENRPPDQSPAAWAEEVHIRIKPSNLVLRSYGGAELPTVRQVSCTLSKGDLSVKSMMHV